MTAVAIVGLGCRFPDSPDVGSFWRLLSSGAKALSELPASRWAPHAQVPTRASTLKDLSAFDADFFRISAEEACELDPQQRLLLEVAWEALEDAGHATASLNGSATGVFVGISVSEYRDFSVMRDAPVTGFTTAAAALNFAANRISGVLGLEGPSFTVDSTCASSAVATHLACQSLERGECDRALVGGAYLMLSRHAALGFSKLKYLSADGETRAFDARAAGYGRGEGAGMVVLRRLEDALSDRDRIYAVICGTALRHKGRTNGLLGPSRPAQEAVLETACRNAGVSPRDVQFVEGVGISNPLADAMEVAALGKVLGAGRAESMPLRLGTLNANIGYLETASGIAKLIKLALAVKHRTLPGTLNFEQPNPAVAWGSIGVRVLTETSPWPRPDAPLLAGMSSFAMGGTHAHVLLTDPPANPRPRPNRGRSPQRLLTVSARSPEALRELAGRYSVALSSGGSLATSDLETVASAAAARRMHHDERLAVGVTSHAEVSQVLSRFAGGQLHGAWASGTFRGAAPSVGVLVADDSAPVDPSSLGPVAALLGEWDSALRSNGLELDSSAQLRAGSTAPTLEGRAARAGLALSTARWLMEGGLAAPKMVLGGANAALVAAFLAKRLTFEEVAAALAHGASPDPSATQLRVVTANDAHEVGRLARDARLKHILDLGGATGPSLTDLNLDRVVAVGVEQVLAALYVLGAWEPPLSAAASVEAVELPPHPWRRKTFWLGLEPRSVPPQVESSVAAAVLPTPPPPRASLTLGELQGLSATARTERVARYLQALFSEFLAPGSSVPLDEPVANIGLDSIRAIQVLQRVTLDLGFGFSLLALLKGASLVALAEEIVAQVPKG